MGKLWPFLTLAGFLAGTFARGDDKPKPLATLEGHNGVVSYVVFNADGKLLRSPMLSCMLFLGTPKQPGTGSGSSECPSWYSRSAQGPASDSPALAIGDHNWAAYNCKHFLLAGECLTSDHFSLLS
jgi:hypothetical protein